MISEVVALANRLRDNGDVHSEPTLTAATAEQLHAVVVDDAPDVRRLLVSVFTRSGVRVTPAEDSLEAMIAVKAATNFNQHLDFITTDLLHPPTSGFNGITLVHAIRSLPDEIVVRGGKRVRHLPIIVISAYGDRADIKSEIASIDPDIAVVPKPFTTGSLVALVGKMLGEYRRRLLAELRQIGLAIVCDNGRYRVMSAFARKTGQVDSKFLVATTRSAGHVYSRIVLAIERGMFGYLAVQEFEQLLNAPGTDERDLQRFIELHPEFILRGQYGQVWPQMALRQGRKLMRPDFVLEPRALRESPWSWGLVDLKRHNVPLTIQSRLHPDLSSHVYRVVNQLRDYAEYFEDERNADRLRAQFAGVVPKPRLVAIIGRLPWDHIDKYAVLRSRVHGVTLTTYDEVLEQRRSAIAREAILYGDGGIASGVPQG